MARSVDYLNNAYHVYYIDGSDYDDQFEWDDFKYDLNSILKKMFPSLDECDKWEGNETRIFLENSFCEVGLSSYCGLVSLSFRWHYGAEYNTEALFNRWFDSIETKLTEKLNKCYNMLNLYASLGNGECVYTRAS